ncbi:calcium-responsive transactivator-like isoform X2 [Pristis pectinata]|uniref:calcium-responsive transactivator-like isoform X2 n=1 Tax=Pristis pectinata TaxID=685728 RepID=UPI00223D6F18|nr:calcium-responsive transactivator-like isoform X2 [Pristis pectinata]
MSVVFVPQRLRSKCEINQATIQKLLDENNQLIQCIVEYQNIGKAAECTQYQQILHRNLIYLATIADSSQNVATAHPATLNQPMTMGPGAMEPVGRAADAMGSGTPPPGQGNPHQMAVPAQQQGSQGELFNQQFNQTQAPAEGMNLQLYSEGSSWFGPPQGQFQQNPSAHQQTFYQQYGTQQPLTSTPQEFNSAQNSQGQFRSFQQDPGQQYVAYRPQQPAPNPAQQQAFQYGQGAAFGGFQ